MILVVGLAGMVVAQSANAQSTEREGRWETRLGVSCKNWTDMDFKCDTSAVKHPCETMALAGGMEAALRGLIRQICVDPATRIAEVDRANGLDLAVSFAVAWLKVAILAAHAGARPARTHPLEAPCHDSAAHSIHRVRPP